MKRILAVMSCALCGCIYADVKTPLAYRAPTTVWACPDLVDRLIKLLPAPFLLPSGIQLG